MTNRGLVLLLVAFILGGFLAFLVSPFNAQAAAVSWDRPAVGRINPINILDTVFGNIFTATSTTAASTFPFASTTVTSATTVCLSTDCRTVWPSGLTPGGTAGQVQYKTSANTFGGVATGTVSNGTGISVTASQSVIGSGLTITNTGVTSNVAGTGISLSGSTGAVTITNTAPDQTVVLTPGTGISTSGTYPNFTITNTAPLTFSYPFPNSATSSALTLGGLTLSNITGSTQCLHVNSSGVVSGTSADCGTGSGGVTSVSTTYPLQTTSSTGAITLSTAFGTTTSNTFAGTQTFTNSPVFSTLGAGTVNSTAAGTLYNTATSTPTVSAPITYSGTLGSFVGGSSGAFACTNASAGVTGCLTGTDWSTFNNKQYAFSTSTLSASSPLTGSFVQVGSGGSLGIQAASASQNGYLSNLDFSLLHTATSTFTSPLIYTAGTNAVTCQVATGSVPGCLAAADFTTFNGKQAAGNYITALTGDGTASGPGSAALTLATVNGNVGSFTNANVTVNAKGLVTAVSNGSGGSGTVSTGAAGQFGYFSSAGTTIAGSYFGYASSTNSATLLGVGAGGQNSTTTNTSNSATAIGFNALNSLTTGTLNTAVGIFALAADNNFDSNTAVGASALKATNASNNTGVGKDALLANTSGSANTVVGQSALSLNTTGLNNVSIGYHAGDSTTGAVTGNTFVGYQTGGQNASGLPQFSTDIGYEAGFNSTGYGNLFDGVLAGQNLTTGNNNISIGPYTFLPSVTASNQLNIGNLIWGTLAVATSSSFSAPVFGTVGIGTSTPWGTFSVASTSAAALVVADGFNTINALFNTASTTGSIFTVAATTTTNAQIIAGTPIKLFDVDQYGHDTASSTFTPVLSSCGSTPTFGTNANDVTGTINVGTGTVTACTLTFGSPYITTPTVVISDSLTTVTADVSAISTTAFTVSLSGSIGGGKIYYIVMQP